MTVHHKLAGKPGNPSCVSDDEIVPGERYAVKTGVTLYAYLTLQFHGSSDLMEGTCFTALSSYISLDSWTPFPCNGFLVLVDGERSPRWIVSAADSICPFFVPVT